MNDALTPDQIAQYQEQGFIVIDDFLDATELEHWRTNTQEAVDQRLAEYEKKDDLPTILNNQSKPDTYYARVFTQCLKLAESHAGMHEIIHDPRLGKLTATLAGVDGMRIWHDQALFKPPYGNPTAWHLDNPYWSFSSRQAISLWVALDDATLENGCLYYVPGTQKTARYDNAGIGQNIGELFNVYPEWKEISPIATPCRAGGAVLHNGLTAHGAGANMTNKPRRAMTCAYMPDGSAFNGRQNVLPEAYFQTLKPGDLLNDNTVNPLLWSKG